MRCKNPYRSSSHRSTTRDTEDEDSDDDDDGDNDEEEDEEETEEEEEEEYDSSPPILTKAQTMFGVKRKVRLQRSPKLPGEL